MHPKVRGVSFVGSTEVGRHIYATAAANGKRVQALTEAKNHALVMRDAPIRATAQRIINSVVRLCRGAVHGAPGDRGRGGDRR